MSKIIKASKVNRILSDFGYKERIDKPLTKFKLEILLRNIGLKTEKIRDIIKGFD